MSNIAPESTDAAQAAEAFGYVSLASGRTHLLYPRGHVTRVSAGGRSDPANVGAAGVIYTDAADMPSLEELLRQHEVAIAVLERPAPAVQALAPSGQTGRVPRRISTRRIVAAASIPAATAAVGWTLFADSISDDAVHANPYTALILALSGFVFLASLLAALRD